MIPCLPWEIDVSAMSVEGSAVVQSGVERKGKEWKGKEPRELASVWLVAGIGSSCGTDQRLLLHPSPKRFSNN